MSRTVRSTLLAGGLLAVFAFLLVDHGGHLGLSLVHYALLGAALGAALGLVPDRAPAWRAGAFVWGFLACWLGYALRAGVLPDIPIGRAIAAVIVVVLVTIAAAASLGHMPMWAGLLGVAAVAGAYETTFTADPTRFTHDSTVALTTVLFAAAVGFVAGTFAGEAIGSHEVDDIVDVTAGDRPAVALPTQTTTQKAADSGIAIVSTEADPR